MSRIIAGIALVAALAFLAVSGVINARFGWSIGQSDFDSQVYASLSVASDILKAVCVVFLVTAWAQKNYISFGIAALLFVLTTVYSITSAIGFNALNRDTLQNERELNRAQYQALTSDMEKAREDLEALPIHRPAEVIDADIQAKQQRRRWTATKACTDATVPQSRTFCEAYHLLQAELAAAKKAEELNHQIGDLNRQLASLDQAVSSDTVDPQLSALSDLIGQKENNIRSAMNLLLAILCELGSGLGLYLTLNYIRQTDAKKKPLKTTPSSVLSIDHFVADRITQNKGASVYGGDLFQAFKAWVSANNAADLEMSNSMFGRLMGERFDKRKVGGRIKYFDIQLVTS
ncbi:MAG: hypothetical protein AAF292_11095 [Pseudomonadota bacterium]